MRLFFLNKRFDKSFTLVELLVVVSIIGILSGVLLTVVKPARQQQIAQDGVRRSNIEKLAQALEAYCAAEGNCPSRNDSADAASVARTVYIKVWPTDATYTYDNNGANAGATNSTAFEVWVPTATNTARYLRYNSVWAKIQECANGGGVINWTAPVCTP
jgi:prepilin-type N-terminal cleavage/methylation domain-containing protein